MPIRQCAQATRGPVATELESEHVPDEEQLAESEAMLAVSFRNAPIAMYVKDGEGRYVRLDQEIANVLDVPIEAALGKNA